MFRAGEADESGHVEVGVLAGVREELTCNHNLAECRIGMPLLVASGTYPILMCF